mmetsp:Transcript_87719/g.246444  ORF Transcript_87719/g.246444 Transcript_87719/m.246444 type:complete len:200 (+) Transcript_87719:206-805(+)
MNDLRVSTLGLLLHLLSPLLIEILLLDLLELSSEPVDFVLVVADLRLVRLQLGLHCLHLFRFGCQVLLIELELLHDLRSGLLLENPLQLLVQALLLTDLVVLGDDLLGLLNEAFLQRPDFLDELVHGWVRPLKLPPAVHVHRVLELLRQGFHLRALLEQVALQVVHLLLMVVDVVRLTLCLEEVELQGRDTFLLRLDLL